MSDSYPNVGSSANGEGVILKGASERKEPAVITSIVMISCDSDSISEVAYQIAELPGVSEVYSTTGIVDLIAMVRVRAFDDVEKVIAGGIAKVPGVVHTDTHIAFRAYSKHDLEETFSIGFPDAT
ncbi:hypothetical protein GCM10009765_61470 [Fodinicola feengrottensis]|uniref:Transcription regulator AsnC/Lrp ligand binding domain-containing protein n=1 Tax=Fodinicola feengrottensis TaxID=435914 RepID=A0ABP4UJR9_9ACTN